MSLGVSYESDTAIENIVGRMKTASEPERYIKTKVIGRGAFGEVYEAQDTHTNVSVAIKKFSILNHENGIEFSTIRELKILQELSHPNIIKFLDVFHKKENLYLVLELAPFNLMDLAPLGLSSGAVKTVLRQVLDGLSYLHKNWIMHRDLSPSNILITQTGEVKITDFGLAKVLNSAETKHTRFVTTRWYRAPEILFGTYHYGRAIDLWAVGCIFAELLGRRPLFQGDNDLQQVATIFNKLGTPGNDDWPGVNLFPNYMKQQASPALVFERAFPEAESQAFDLLRRLLVYSPLGRIHAEEALLHPYFTTGEAAVSNRQLIDEIVRKLPEARNERS